ncbi:MAG: hypothetical protein MK226_03240 [Saprospiraceae bacterium]|nr:hypothetical protein [Saprospiraceae bacterium]
MRLFNLLISLSFLSCTKEVKIVRIESPIMDFYKEVNIQLHGEMIYQFYHKYGFTDVIDRVISISALEDSITLAHPYPIDSTILTKEGSFDYQRFLPEENIHIHKNYLVNKDVSLKVFEYGLPPDVMIIQEGSYEVIQKGQISALRIIDKKKRLEYLEVVRTDEELK